MTFNTLLKKIKNDHNTAQTIDALGGIKTQRVQSDKLGYDWLQTLINDIVVRSEYVAQDNPVGVADNPIMWTAGVQLIPNAYYLYNGVRYVYMGETSTAGTTWDATNMEEF